MSTPPNPPNPLYALWKPYLDLAATRAESYRKQFEDILLRMGTVDYTPSNAWYDASIVTSMVWRDLLSCFSYHGPGSPPVPPVSGPVATIVTDAVAETAADTVNIPPGEIILPLRSMDLDRIGEGIKPIPGAQVVAVPSSDGTQLSVQITGLGEYPDSPTPIPWPPGIYFGAIYDSKPATPRLVAHVHYYRLGQMPP